MVKTSFEETHEIAKDIEGWLGINEARLLYETASKLKGEGVIVEIGSWCAKSVTYICSGAFTNGFKNKFFSIDPFLTSKDEPNGKYETFITNLKKYDLYDKVTHIKEKSQIAGKTFDEKIEFIFIDGFHKYEAVKADFELFYPKLIEGGFIAIHDITYYQGPTDLVKELVASNTFKIIEFTDSTILAQKTNNLTNEDIESNKTFIEKIDRIIANKKN